MHARFNRLSADVTTATKTILQVHAADTARPLKVLDFGIYFNGVAALDPGILCQLVIQTTPGTGGGGNTPVKLSREADDAIQASGLDDSTPWSVEPTTTDILAEWYVHPQGGYEKPVVKEYTIGSNERVAIRTPNGASVTVKGTAYIEIEE